MGIQSSSYFSSKSFPWVPTLFSKALDDTPIVFTRSASSKAQTSKPQEEIEKITFVGQDKNPVFSIPINLAKQYFGLTETTTIKEITLPEGVDIEFFKTIKPQFSRWIEGLNKLSPSYGFTSFEMICVSRLRTSFYDSLNEFLNTGYNDKSFSTKERIQRYNLFDVLKLHFKTLSPVESGLDDIKMPDILEKCLIFRLSKNNIEAFFNAIPQYSPAILNLEFDDMNTLAQWCVKWEKLGLSKKLMISVSKLNNENFLYEKSNFPERSLFQNIKSFKDNVISLTLKGNYKNNEILMFSWEELTNLESLTLEGEFDQEIFTHKRYNRMLLSDRWKSFTQLKKLKLKGDFLPDVLGMGRGLSQLTNLIELTISRVSDNKDVINIAQELSNLEHLKEFNVEGDFTDEGAKVLVEALSHLPHLSALTIEGRYKEEGANAIAEALEIMLHLQELNLKGRFKRTNLMKVIFTKLKLKQLILDGIFYESNRVDEAPLDGIAFGGNVSISMREIVRNYGDILYTLRGEQ